jgi:hypothetical protein
LNTFIFIVDDGSAIEEVRAVKEEITTGWCTLDGRRLSGKPTHRGVYIHNGKKVVIK